MALSWSEVARRLRSWLLSWLFWLRWVRLGLLVRPSLCRRTGTPSGAGAGWLRWLGRVVTAAVRCGWVRLVVAGCS
jgi:hypothetical protein